MKKIGFELGLDLFGYKTPLSGRANTAYSLLWKVGWVTPATVFSGLHRLPSGLLATDNNEMGASLTRRASE